MVFDFDLKDLFDLCYLVKENSNFRFKIFIKGKLVLLVFWKKGEDFLVIDIRVSVELFVVNIIFVVYDC